MAGSSPKRSPKCSPKKKAKARAGPKNGDRSKARPKQVREHENMQNRVRYHLNKSKTATRDAWKKATKAEKKAWTSTFEKTGNFDHVESKKEKMKEKRSESKRLGVWNCKDKILELEGWSEANKNTEFGQRAALRAEARIAHCRRMHNKKEAWVDLHPQHGDEIFKCVGKEDNEINISKELIGTSLSKSGARVVVKVEGR